LLIDDSGNTEIYQGKQLIQIGKIENHYLKNKPLSGRLNQKKYTNCI
jgi:hypothetical protein